MVKPMQQERIIPTGIIIVFFSSIVYENIIETFSFGEKIYPYYLVLFSFVIPLGALLIAKIRKRM